MNEHFFNYNGKFYKEGNRIITPDNRGLKYGDGLFETIKMVNGKLQLKEYHFERLFTGLKTLAFHIPPAFSPHFLEKEIIVLAKKNNHFNTTRIRLMVLRGDGSFTERSENIPHYIIQTQNLPGNTLLNLKGFKLDVYPDVKKSCDILSNLKTNNFLPYSLAAMYAKKNKLDDCILLNSMGNISDTAIANVFIIKNKKFYTPSLNQGCIAGVMRRWIIERIKIKGNVIVEKAVRLEDLKKADEVFLTNSIHPIRWVKQFQNVQYTNNQVQLLFKDLIKTL